MSVDLHVHSVVSDGTKTPTELVTMADDIGLEAMALTDHDNLGGIPEAREAAAEIDVELIPGTELSLDYERGGMHLVVLWLEPEDGPLQDRLEALREGRDDRNEAIVAALNGLGFEITTEEVCAEAGAGSAGRPHIASVMLKKGYVTDMRSAFDLWLEAGKPAYVPRTRLGPADAIGLARQSGAVPVLAHPHTLGIHDSTEMANLLGELVEVGLVGLEAHYALYHRHIRHGYADLARRFGLVPSGGSDYHGDYKPGLTLGRGYGDLTVPDSVLEELREHRR